MSTAASGWAASAKGLSGEASGSCESGDVVGSDYSVYAYAGVGVGGRAGYNLVVEVLSAAEYVCE